MFPKYIKGSLRNDDGDVNENGKKAIGLDWQNNNFARTSRFFVHFCTTTTWKCLFSRFVEDLIAWTWLSFLFLDFDINSRKNCQRYLTNWRRRNKRDKILSSATSLLEWRFRSRRRRCCLRWCYTRRFAMMIFSATQRCNIVAKLFRIVTTLFQHCNAVFPWKSSLRIVPCNHWKLKKWAANASLTWEVSLSLFAFTRDLIAFNTVLSS